MSDTETRVRTIVTDVLREHLRRRDGQAFVLDGLDTPERRLLAEWLLAAGLPLRDPDPERVEAVADALAGADAEPEVTRRAAIAAVVRCMVGADGLVALSCETRTTLVLDGATVAVAPLGGVPASIVAGWVGDATLPALLRGRDPGLLGPLDEALSRFFDRGEPLGGALADLPPDLARDVKTRLERVGVPAARPPLVPKVGGWTPGHDLAP
jgi:hypothetical protein